MLDCRCVGVAADDYAVAVAVDATADDATIKAADWAREALAWPTAAAAIVAAAAAGIAAITDPLALVVLAGHVVGGVNGSGRG